MQNYRGYNNYSNIVSPGEKIIAALSYLTAGFVGLAWIIFCTLAKQKLREFIKFHAYQSILISLIIWMLSLLFGIILTFIKFIPFIGIMIINAIYYITEYPFIFGYSLIQIIMGGLIIYLVATCLMGKKSEVPYVSDIVRQMH